MQTIPTTFPTLDLIIGCMYSGKSTELLRCLTKYAAMESYRICYVNSSLDNRNDKVFSTHNPTITRIGNIDGIKCLKLGDNKEIEKYDIIGIDEGQLFEDLVEHVLYYVEKKRRKVIVSGLNGDYQRKQFGEIYKLYPLCDNLTKLFAFCKECDKRKETRSAIFTKRITNETDVVVIGDKSKYIPVCRDCYNLK